MPHNGIKLNLHRGCGTCGSSVSFYTRGWPFKSCHRYIFVVIIFCPVYFYKEKMPRFEIVQYTLSLKVDFIIIFSRLAQHWVGQVILLFIVRFFLCYAKIFKHYIKDLSQSHSNIEILLGTASVSISIKFGS